MKGFWQHVRMTLVLNCRNRQALVFGYVVPVFFLIAFVAIFGGHPEQIKKTIAPLLVISVMGGACFGMPITLVNERDGGVWRRYRLTPLGAGTFITSTIVSRLVLVSSSALLQIALAMWIYGLGWPQQPLMFIAAFLLVTFAFIGIGLIIAAVANSIGAVQALGQSLFLPMIMIGGVGVPLLMLPEWAREFSRFLPGRYAMELIQRAYAFDQGFDIEWQRFKWRALVILLIGLSATIAGWKLFRWESDQRQPRTAWLWVGLALGTWIAAGVLSKLVKLE
jgi:ABC-2 type transport system permease protein